MGGVHIIAFVLTTTLALQSGILSVNADCPKLPSMPLAQPNYYWCTTQAQAVNHACIFVCPTGYSLEDDPNRNFFKFVCQANGTWSGKLHRCVDRTAPWLLCPDITVTPRKGSPSEMVSWDIDVGDNSVSAEPNATITLHSSPESPQNFTIGRHDIQVTATDKAGNKASCNFEVMVRDVEPPTCSFCPGDIVKEGKGAKIRVLWDRPVCTDNSRLPPIITCNRPSGDFFGVPGTYKIQFTVEDFAYPKGNIYLGCSFTITLKRARCPMYPPPMNGALVCMNREDGSQGFCQVACESGTDFVFHPPLLYVCDDSGHWFAHSPFPQSNVQVPWPNCASGAGPSLVSGFSEFFFDGNQTHSKLVSELKDNFLKFVRGPFVPQWYCQKMSGCRRDKVQAYV